MHATTTGTNCFISFSRACQYYATQEDDLSLEDLAALVKAKEAEGAIQIGKPKLQKGQRLVLLDNGTRYGVEG